jgi:Glycosyltransferase
VTDADVIWLTPDKPEHISVGRARVAEHLRAAGYGVTLRGTSGRTAVQTMGEYGDYDAVIGTTRAGALAGTAVSLTHRIPLIVDHIDPISQFHKTHPRWLARSVQAAEIIAFARSTTTLYVYEAERARVERYANRTVQTALGVDFDRFANPDQVILETGRTVLPTNLARPVAVYVGGLEPIYNIETLVSAVEYFEGSLVVAGTGSLKQTVREADDDSVHYFGTIDYETVPGVLAACDVGVSLVDDPHTLKILEYGAAGLPVVQLAGRAQSRLGGLVTYTEPDPESVGVAIAAAVNRGEIGLQAFASEFDWADIAEAYADAITVSIS